MTVEEAANEFGRALGALEELLEQDPAAWAQLGHVQRWALAEAAVIVAHRLHDLNERNPFTPAEREEHRRAMAEIQRLVGQDGHRPTRPPVRLIVPNPN